MALSTRETEKGVERQRRFYTSSLPANAEKPANAIRAHWGTENALHWVLDVNFRDDDCRIREKNACQLPNHQTRGPQLIRLP